MNNREQYKRLLSGMASTAIILLLTGIFICVWFTSYAEIGAKHFVRGNFALIAIYGLISFFVFKIYGGFQISQLRAFDMLYTQTLSIVCINAVTYLQLCLIGRWKLMTNITPIIWMTMADILAVVTWSFCAKWVYMRLYPARKMLLIYGKYSPDELIRKISSRKDKYAIEEAISIDEDIERIKERILRTGAVVMTDIPADLRNKLLKFCFAKNIRCYCVPKISDIMIMSSGRVHLFDTALLVFRNMGLTVEQRFLKRLFDIVASLVFCLVASPVMIAIAIAIKIHDGGPVFFTQDRLTQDGKTFKLYKFRSMYVESSKSGYCMTRKDDDRVTPVGKLIRRIHFDELPQLFNILKGEMSFVGPRPECPELAEKYAQKLPEFPFRLKVKAGLTGYAQVYGKYNTTPYDKLKLDLTYIENYSFLLDMKLIILTVRVLFQKENTEGIEAWQTSAEKNKD